MKNEVNRALVAKKKIFTLFAVLTMGVGLWASNTITYTAPEKINTLNVGTKCFGPKITSHEFSNGTGIITCDGEITTIGLSAFADCTGLTSIIIPGSVTEIGEDAFENCTGLSSIILPASVTKIGEKAFQGCSGLSSIILPASVTEIGEMTFQRCSGLTSVTFEGNDCTIGYNAFNDVGSRESPALLFLPIDWSGAEIGEYGSWYGGYFTDGLKKVKQDAVEAINAAATAAKEEIDAASSYPAANATKEYYKTEIDNAIKSAKPVIREFFTVAEVDAERSKYILKIENLLAAAKAAIAPINTLEQYKEKVIGEIENARLHNLLPELDEEQKEYVNETIDDAVNAVNAATTKGQIDKAEAKIFFILSMYPAGKAAGIEETLGEMGDECTDCTAVEVKKGDKVVTLYAPTGVDYIKK